MPAPNDLTPEEEAQFVEHGVQPAGPGSEPIVEKPADIQDQSEEPPVAHEPVADEAVVAARPRNPDGTFMSAEQIAAQQPQEEPAVPEAQQSRMVPHEALHQERQRAAQAIRQSQLLTTRMNAMLAQQQQQPENAAPLPSLEEDPAGYILALERRLNQFEEVSQQSAQERQLDQALGDDESLFSQSVPDYEQASDHYVQSRARELLQFNTPEQAQKVLMAEARQIATQAWQRGLSAGQVVYNLAQARGYTPGNTAANPVNAPIPPRSQGPTPSAVVRGVQAGQQASRTLSGGGNSGGVAQLNAEAVLAMTDDEFQEYIQLGSKGADARFAAIG